MMKEKNKNLVVFVRHGHRDKPLPDADNGLSSKGLIQVEELKTDYKKGRLPQAKQFWSSPKKRCLETLKPLSQLAKVDLKIEKLLDEQHPSETQTQFHQRIEALIKKVVNANETIYLCSHGDLIPDAINALTGRAIDVSKGQAIQLIFSNGEWGLL